MGDIIDRKLFCVLILLTSEVLKVCTQVWGLQSDLSGKLITPEDDGIVKLPSDNYQELCDDDCRASMNEISVQEPVKKKRPSISSSLNSVETFCCAPHYFGLAMQRPCSCISEYISIDLGTSFRPRHIPSVRCRTDCPGGHFQCHEQKYSVKVLRHRLLLSGGNRREPRGNDGSVPEELRKSWIMTNVDVAVACQCRV